MKPTRSVVTKTKIKEAKNAETNNKWKWSMQHNAISNLIFENPKGKAQIHTVDSAVPKSFAKTNGRVEYSNLFKST